jgi:DNA topoisomerase I
MSVNERFVFVPDHLIIVESPAKSKTLEKYLGASVKVLASYGHVRDLKPKTGAVIPENDFEMVYEPLKDHTKHVDAITKQIKTCKTLSLATDPDREGEAIAWHVLSLIEKKQDLSKLTVQRVVFNQITKKAVIEAFNQPRQLDHALINAQQTRRALDYLVGFHLSPLLWKKIRTGLSAGRVQSPALRLVVEREQEIKAFKEKEYWHVEAKLKKKKQEFIAKLLELEQEKLTQFSLTTEAQTESVLTQLKAKGIPIVVKDIKAKTRQRRPYAPFITSTLQQEASRKLGYGAAKTMRLAQQLYEGIDLGNEQVGLITYMRTDSVNLANEAIDQIRECIVKTYGQAACPKSPNRYQSKSKNAQEAHEAIRPTDMMRTADQLAKHLSKEQLNLYQLIWQRSIASQMNPAIYDTLQVLLSAGSIAILKANGSTLKSPGFLSVYEEGQDDVKKEDKQESAILPPLKVGDTVDLVSYEGKQHFTEPPPRYSEATLVKALEAQGIGRPSTYASILSTIQQREYVTQEKKRFHPTTIGEIVSQFLVNHFNTYVDLKFTASLEDELDAIARNEADKIACLKKFWQPFSSQIEEVEANVTRESVTSQPLDEKCPECEKPLHIKLGRHGQFIGCTNYPDCRYTRPLSDNPDDAGEQPPAETVGRACPKCQQDLVYKQGRYGKFIGCSGYPDCRHIESLQQTVDTEITCPTCQKGHMVQKRTRRGKVFYACDQFPGCKYALWYEPKDQACSTCGFPITMIKSTKRDGDQRVCPQEKCDFKEVMVASD